MHDVPHEGPVKGSAQGWSGREDMPNQAAPMIADILAPVLAQAGFKKSKLTWRRDGRASIHLVNVQASRFGDLAYINLGVYFREYGSLSVPALPDCHVYERLNAIVPAPQRENELLSFMNKVTLEERRTELPVLLREYGLRWLDENDTVDATRARMLTRKWPMINDAVYPLLTPKKTR